MSKMLDKTKELIDQLNPRFIASDPWRGVDESLESLIDKIVVEFNPEVLDDDLPDVMDDWDERLNAIDYLINKLLKMKEE